MSKTRSSKILRSTTVSQTPNGSWTSYFWLKRRLSTRFYSQNLYDSQTRRWMGFPDLTCRESESEKKKPQEKSLYDPFSAIAEAIQKVAETQRGSSVSKMGATKWVGYHSKSPKSQDTRAAQLRPDALFALQTVADHTASNEPQVEILF